MKFSILLTCCCLFSGCLLVVCAQARDPRTKLSPEGRPDVFSVSPDGTLWLATYAGRTYFSPKLGASWQEGPAVCTGKLPWDECPHLRKIAFFDADTAVMMGASPLRQGYWRTTDKGAHWTFMPFSLPGTASVQEVFADAAGRAWATGSLGNLLWSNDFGRTWQSLPSPFIRNIESVWMADALHGIAGAAGDGVYVTHDNWNTSIRLTSLPEQRGRTAGAVKVRICRGACVMLQDSVLAWQKPGAASWTRLEEKVLDFEVDMERDRLMVILAGRKVLEMLRGGKRRMLHPEPLPEAPRRVACAMGALYVYDYQGVIHCLEKGSNVSEVPCTRGYRMEKPWITARQGQHVYGIVDRSLFQSADSGKTWVKEAWLNKEITHLYLLRPGVLILTEGHSDETWRYSLADHTLEPFVYPKPLNDFLRYPLKSVCIEKSTVNYEFSSSVIIEFTAGMNGLLMADSIHYRGAKSSRKGERYTDTLDAADVRRILTAINRHPRTLPGNIPVVFTPQELGYYQNYVKSYRDAFLSGGNTEKSEFLADFPAQLDTMARQERLDLACCHAPLGWGVLSDANFITLRCENTHGDIVHISRQIDEPENPFSMAWEVCVQEKRFRCCHPDILPLISGCVPASLLPVDQAAHWELLIRMAEAAWERRINTGR